jgi:hypothetical protein
MDSHPRQPHFVRKARILGFGLDCSDGHTRITRGDDFLLVGGSEETHDEMRAKLFRFNQELERRGKTIENVTEAELDEIAADLD